MNATLTRSLASAGGPSADAAAAASASAAMLHAVRCTTRSSLISISLAQAYRSCLALDNTEGCKTARARRSNAST